LITVGHWIDGVCSGEVEEYDPCGKLTWKGTYLDGVRHGFGVQYFPVLYLSFPLSVTCSSLWFLCSFFIQIYGKWFL
jgi:hypothetical protein